jgi:hypothetical protein
MRGEGGREHKKHVTSRLLFPLAATEAQLLLEKYDAEDAIARERVMSVIFMQIFVLVVFPKKRDTLQMCRILSTR